MVRHACTDTDCISQVGSRASEHRVCRQGGDHNTHTFVPSVKSSAITFLVFVPIEKLATSHSLARSLSSLRLLSPILRANTDLGSIDRVREQPGCTIFPTFYPSVQAGKKKKLALRSQRDSVLLSCLQLWGPHQPTRGWQQPRRHVRMPRRFLSILTVGPRPCHERLVRSYNVLTSLLSSSS